MSVQIEEVVLRVVGLPLREPFRTSLGTITEREVVIVEVCGGGISGWGEAAVLPFPSYTAETPVTALHILKDFAVPLFFAHRPASAAETGLLLNGIVGHRFARAALEMAHWDWESRLLGVPLHRRLGGVRSEIPVGVAVPLDADRARLHESIAAFLARGYQRIKIKIAPGEDIEVVEGIRHRFGGIPLMADANSAYSLADTPQLLILDQFELTMIEQPLGRDDLLEHAELQRHLTTPLCLDESIEHGGQAAAALKLGSCRILNIKPGRVGGLAEAVRMQDIAEQHGCPVWCGGMLETGIGRATNIALATLPNFSLPGDISESARYFHEDIVTPPFELTNRGTLRVPEGPGNGVEVDRTALTRATRHTIICHP